MTTEQIREKDYAGKSYESIKPNTASDWLITLFAIGIFVAQVLAQI